MKQLLITSSFLLMFLGCSSKDKGDTAGIALFSIEDTLHKIGEIRLPIDEKGIIELSNHQPFEFDGVSYLFVLNKVNHSLDIYNLIDHDFKGRIPIPNEGPFALPVVQGFFVHSPDSIFVFPQGHLKNAILINDLGEVVLQFKPPSVKNTVHGLVNHVSAPASPSYLISTELHLSILPLLDTSDPDNITNDVLISAEYDLSSNQFEFSKDISFPDSYVNKGWSVYHGYYSRILNHKNEWIYSWAASDSLFIYGQHYRMIDKKLVKSGFLNDIPFFTNKISVINQLQVGMESGAYSRILYDPFRNCYYRIVRHGHVFNPQNDTDYKSLSRADFSIIKTNENFDVVSESVFTGELYDYMSIFVSERGLHLPRTNYWYEGLDEDEVIIDVYL